MITVITNRKQVLYTDLVTHLKKCNHENVDRIILREKDMSVEQIKKKIALIKADHNLRGIPLMVNGPYPLTEAYGADGRHYTLDQYKGLSECPDFKIGVSIHSLEEIEWMNTKKADYLLYGHIFSTACKAGLAAKGIDNLDMLIERSNHPLIALGGIDTSNYKQIYKKGGAGFALMSSVMKATSPNLYLDGFEKFKNTYREIL